MLDMFKKISFNFLQISKDYRDLINDTLTSPIFNFKRIIYMSYEIYIFVDSTKGQSYCFLSLFYHLCISFIYFIHLYVDFKISFTIQSFMYRSQRSTKISTYLHVCGLNYEQIIEEETTFCHKRENEKDIELNGEQFSGYCCVTHYTVRSCTRAQRSTAKD